MNRVSRGLPSGRKAATDRAPDVEELQKLIEYPDPRINAIVCMMISSGIRKGAWDELELKHITPEVDGFARMLIYPGDKMKNTTSF
jgi:hypothetical protein